MTGLQSLSLEGKLPRTARHALIFHILQGAKHVGIRTHHR